MPDEPGGEHMNVQEGDRVRAGEPLMDRPSNPHDRPGLILEEGKGGIQAG